MKRLAITGVCSCLLLLASAAHAEWYLGGNAGMASTDVDSGELNARLAKEGLPGSADISTNERLGWRLFGGYQWGDYLAVEGGYTNLGKLEVDYPGTGAMTADNLEAVHPASGTGFELSVLGRYPFTLQVSGFIRAGMLAWKSEYSVNNGSDVSFSGTDPLVGIGGAWRFDERWSLRLAWDRYTMAKDDTELISVGISYRFAEQHDTSHAKTDKRPQPVAKTESEPAAPDKPVVAEQVRPEQDPDKPVEAEQVKPEPAAKPVKPKPAPLTPQQWLVHYGFEAVESNDADAALAAAVEKLKAYPHAVVSITGHSDHFGPEKYNVYLSRQRAELLARALIERGVAKERITVKAVGSSEPLADSHTKAGRAQNRRAEIDVHALVSSSN